MRDMLIARPLHALVIFALRFNDSTRIFYLRNSGSTQRSLSATGLSAESATKRDNDGLQRRARTAASDKPCMRDKLIARPLQGFVIPPRIVAGFHLHSPERGSAALMRHQLHPNYRAPFQHVAARCALLPSLALLLQVFKFRDAG
jgi:hypothetical protein